MADRFGAPFTVAAGGAVAIAGSIVFGLRLPALRPEARRLIMAQHMVGGRSGRRSDRAGRSRPDLIKK